MATIERSGVLTGKLKVHLDSKKTITDFIGDIAVLRIDKNSALLIVEGECSCADIVCYSGNDFILINRMNGFIDEHNVSYETQECWDFTRSILTDNLIMLRSQSEILRENTETGIYVGTGAYEYDNDFLLIEKDTIIDLKNANKKIIRKTRNKIFAWYGYQFNSPDLIEYFSHFTWYKPRFNNIDTLLSEEEKRFVNDLLKIEKNK